MGAGLKRARAAAKVTRTKAPHRPLTKARIAANHILNAAALPIKVGALPFIADAIAEAIEEAVAQALIAAVRPSQELEREALSALVRAGIAAAAQSKAEAAYQKARSAYDATQMIKCDRLGREYADAQRETCAAGAAISKAMRALQGAK